MLRKHSLDNWVYKSHSTVYESQSTHFKFLLSCPRTTLSCCDLSYMQKFQQSTRNSAWLTWETLTQTELKKRLAYFAPESQPTTVWATRFSDKHAPCYSRGLESEFYDPDEGIPIFFKFSLVTNILGAIQPTASKTLGHEAFIFWSEWQLVTHLLLKRPTVKCSLEFI